MDLFRKIISNTVLAIQVLIAFVLVFENTIIIPTWLQSFGRLHPLLLHLPIGLLLISAALIFTRKFFDSPSFEDLITFLLCFTALTASLSAFMGIVLSHEGGYNPDDLGLHKWLGVSLSFLCWALLSIKQTNKILRPVLALGVVLLIFTGHFGATLTHGENFVFGPLQQHQLRTRIITDTTTVFAAAIDPIFESKCLSCHNEEKAKGKLILTSLESILKGGKDGVLWKPNDPAHSLLVNRLELPLDHKKHMPPKDKAQLTDDEIEFISRWIASGADHKKKLNELPDTDTLKRMISSIIFRYQHHVEDQQQYHFQFASQQKIKELSTPNRTVFPISRNEPALQADFYLSGAFQKKYLEELSGVKEQIVAINLSKMPITDADLSTMSQFKNLEKLILNNTNITGEGLKSLINLEHLHTLSLSGTKVTAEALKILGSSKSLKDVFIWNTTVSDEEIRNLQPQFGKINLDRGYEPDKTEMLRLSPPILRNDGQVLKSDEPVLLRHNLPGTEIRYAFENGEPDSVKSPVYKDPIALSKYSVLKVKAYKDGWLSSNKTEFVFFKKGAVPSKGELLTKPDSKYQGDGIITLMDEKKGMPDFYRDPVWMGFREEPLEAYFFFEGDVPSVSNITLSYARNVGAMCMPPAIMEVWGGPNPKNLKLLKKITPQQPTSYVSTRIEGATVEIPASKYACYKIVAKPLSKLPEFRKEKKQKGWLMVDEIYFN